jgi:hypothetical protein
MSIMREATMVYAPAGGPSCVLGSLRVNADDTLEWDIRKDVSITSEDDAEVIAGLSEYLKDGSASIGGMALFEWIVSTFSHTIQIQESASQPVRLAAGQAIPY